MRDTQGHAGLVTKPQLRQLYDYWESKRSGPRFPAHTDIVLDEISGLLPHVMLVEVLTNGRHFRFLVIGSALIVGVDPTGKLQHEEMPAGIYRDHLTALYRRGAAGPGALYSCSRYGYAEIPGPRAVCRLFMPLASDGETVDRMMIGQVSDRELRPGFSSWQTNPPSIVEEIEFRLP